MVARDPKVIMNQTPPTSDPWFGEGNGGVNKTNLIHVMIEIHSGCTGSLGGERNDAWRRLVEIVSEMCSGGEE